MNLYPMLTAEQRTEVSPGSIWAAGTSESYLMSGTASLINCDAAVSHPRRSRRAKCRCTPTRYDSPAVYSPSWLITPTARLSPATLKCPCCDRTESQRMFEHVRIKSTGSNFTVCPTCKIPVSDPLGTPGFLDGRIDRARVTAPDDFRTPLHLVLYQGSNGFFSRTGRPIRTYKQLIN